MKIPDKKAFIEVLTFLQEYCKAPKERECESCVLHHGDFGEMCLMETWPEYWEIDEIAERLYGLFGEEV